MRYLSPLILYCAALLAGCAAPRPSTVGSNPLPAAVAMNPDAGRGNLLFLSLRLDDGEELPFVVDTGTPWTVFDRSLEPKLGQRLHSGTVWKFGVATDSGIYAAPRLYLGRTPLQMTRTTVATDDFSRIAAQSGHPIMGILGMDVLAHYCLQLDFDAGKIRFLAAAPAKNRGRAFPLYDIGDGCYAISGNLDGVPEPGTMIDTGCNDYGWLTASVFAQWTNPQPAPGEARRPDGVLGGTIYRDVNLRGLAPGTPGNGDPHLHFNGIGLQFLARHQVTLDFPNQTLYLK